MPYAPSFAWTSQLCAAFSGAAETVLGLGTALVLVIGIVYVVAMIIVIWLALHQIQFLPVTIPSFIFGGVSAVATYNYFRANPFSIWGIPPEFTANMAAIMPITLVVYSGLYFLFCYGSVSYDVDDGFGFLILRKMRKENIREYTMFAMLWSLLAVLLGAMWACREVCFVGTAYIPVLLPMFVFFVCGILALFIDAISTLKEIFVRLVHV